VTSALLLTASSIALRNGACRLLAHASVDTHPTNFGATTSQTNTQTVPTVTPTTNTVVDPRTSTHPSSLGIMRLSLWRTEASLRVGYKVSSWVNFGLVVGPVGGALVGLLFVAASIRASALSASLSLSSRAAQTLVLFTASVVVALVVVAPQPDTAIGLELVGWALVSAALSFILDRRAGHGSTDRAARFVERFSPNGLTSLCLAISGATFLAKHGGGLYWLLPAVAGSLLGGVTSAWLFLISDS
jgi:hypothetical protein